MSYLLETKNKQKRPRMDICQFSPGDNDAAKASIASFDGQHRSSGWQ